MPCEYNKDALIEAAATGGVPQGELRAHLAGCVSCRAAFEQEQSLFTAIDSGLRTTANDEVPPSLLPRVRAAVDEAVFTHTYWVNRWSVLTAAALAVVVIFKVSILRHTNSGGYRQDSVVISSTPRPKQAPPSVVSSARSKLTAASLPTLSQVKNALPQEALSSRSSTLEVLVPDEERVALERFLGAEQEAATQISLAPRPPQKIVDISPLEIAKLDLAPIDKHDAQSSEF